MNPIHNLSSIIAVDGCIENHFEIHKMNENPASMSIYLASKYLN